MHGILIYVLRTEFDAASLCLSNIFTRFRTNEKLFNQDLSRLSVRSMFQLFMIDFSGFVAEYSAHTSKLKFRIRHIFFYFSLSVLLAIP